MFCIKRKPDIVGDFDVITKFDEMYTQRFLNKCEYLKIAEKYIKIAKTSDSIFEVNAGVMANSHNFYIMSDLIECMNYAKVSSRKDLYNLLSRT